MNMTIQMLASYMPKGKELTMKQQMAIVIATIVTAAVIAVILVTRKDLCEVRIRTGHAEVAVFMDYEPK